MKRFISAVVIFLFCAMFSVYCCEKNKKVLTNAREKIEEISVYIEKEEKQKAKDSSLILLEEWEKNRFFIETTIERSFVKEIESAFITLPRLIEKGDKDEALERCLTTLGEIDYIIDKEKLNFENVF